VGSLKDRRIETSAGIWLEKVLTIFPRTIAQANGLFSALFEIAFYASSFNVGSDAAQDVQRRLHILSKL